MAASAVWPLSHKCDHEQWSRHSTSDLIASNMFCQRIEVTWCGMRCRNDPSLAAAEVALIADKAAKSTGLYDEHDSATNSCNP